MKNKNLDEKFNYLKNDIQNKLNIKDLYPLTSDDNSLIKSFYEHLEEKKFEKCKNKIYDFSKYTSNFNLENLNNAKLNDKINKKDFEKSKENLLECLEPFHEKKNTLKNIVQVFENLTSGAFELCLKSINENLKENKINEIETKTSLENCFAYFLRNKNTNSKILIYSKELLIEKL